MSTKVKNTVLFGPVTSDGVVLRIVEDYSGPNRPKQLVIQYKKFSHYCESLSKSWEIYEEVSHRMELVLRPLLKLVGAAGKVSLSKFEFDILSVLGLYENAIFTLDQVYAKWIPTKVTVVKTTTSVQDKIVISSALGRLVSKGLLTLCKAPKSNTKYYVVTEKGLDCIALRLQRRTNSLDLSAVVSAICNEVLSINKTTKTKNVNK